MQIRKSLIRSIPQISPWRMLVIFSVILVGLIITMFYKWQSCPEKITKLDFIDSHTLKQGQVQMKRLKAVFVGISRDNQGELANVIKHIELIGDHFLDYRVIIFENDSNDLTKLILFLWKNKNKKVKVLSHNFFNKKRPSIAFLAKIRNHYLLELARSEYDEFDIVIPLDFDMKYGIDLRGIFHSFSKMQQWDVVCSNGIFNKQGQMYDAFAFRNQEFNTSPLIYNQQQHVYYWDQALINSMQKIYDPKQDLIPVYSCFNGLAIYKKPLFKGCFYDSINEDCEHVALHQCMLEQHQARIFLNPAQLIRYSHYK